MSDDTAEIRRRKTDLRRHLLQQRSAMPAELRAEGARAAARHFAGLLTSLAPPGVVSGFLAIGEEIDPQPCLEAAAALGHRIGLPVMAGRQLPLVFRAWRSGDPLIERKWGIREPTASAEVLEPDVLLVPLLGFDATGGRLGYGGGYYDRTLADLRARRSILAIGLAFDQQCIDSVPVLDYDQRLDAVLTPSGLTRFPPRAAA